MKGLGGELFTTAKKSDAQYRRAQQFMPEGNTRHTVYFAPYPIYAERAEGCRVIDADGNAYLDCINNYSSLIHGHGYPPIVDAAKAQIENLISVGLPTRTEIDLAEILCARVPSVERLRFCNSGSEAVMLAIKAARAYTGRSTIAKLEGAYHGLYDWAELSQAPTPENWGPPTRPQGVSPCRAAPEAIAQTSVILPMNDVEASRSLLLEAAGDLAAILIDLAPSHIAYVGPGAVFLEMLREVADQTGALLILDEVYSLRYAFGGAQQLAGLRPDLTVLGKIIGGGFPIGALGGGEDVMSVFNMRGSSPAVAHGGTYNGNPVSMRAGCAALRHFDAGAVARLNLLGQRLRVGMRNAIDREGLEAQVTGLGSVAAVVMNRSPLRCYRDLPRDDRAKANRAALHRSLLQNGVLSDPRGTFVLSTVFDEASVDEVIAKFEQSIGALT